MEEFDTQNEILQHHLCVIVRECLELQPELIAVILYGSYGRGEGSWYREDGTWKPYNDYDVRIVSGGKTVSKRWEVVRKSLAQEIGIRWIDLGQLHPNDLKRLRPSILNYDLKYASRVVYGDTTILDEIPAIDSSALPLGEIRTLFFTRLYTLIGSLNGNGLSVGVEGEQCRFFRNQMAKAILAVIDVLLLAKGAYDASYCKRLERVCELHPNRTALLDLGKWALTEKLRPQAPSMSPQEVRDLYLVVHQLFFSEMYQGLSMYFNRTIQGPDDIELCMRRRPAAILRRLYWLMKFRDRRMERRLSAALAQVYIAGAWSPNGVSEGRLSRGIALLRCADDSVPDQMTWDEARLEAARLRMLS